jgi:hypothetical protein
VLIALGILVIKASPWVHRLVGAGDRLRLVSLLSSCVIIVVGLWIILWTLLEHNVLVIRAGG